ncbi:hypothetical protein Tco_0025503 [Tanacetum coccineum]
MSDQQDIYAAGSKNRPPMLNKDNYVSWSSRLLHYAKSKPNGKLLVNSIKNGPYAKRIIQEPGDPNSVPPIDEFTHEQTDDELIEKEVKQMEADDQAIQTILMGLLEDIYAAVDSCDTYVGQNIGNQIRYNAGHIVGNHNGYNAVQNVRNQGFAIQMWKSEWRMENVCKQHGMIRGGNGNGNNGNSDKVVTTAQDWVIYSHDTTHSDQGERMCLSQIQDIDEIKEVNANCILMANLQQASTSGTQTDKAIVYDSGETVESHYTVQQNNSNVISMESSVEHTGEIVEQHPATVKEIHAYFESLYNNLAIEVEKVNMVNHKMRETNAI